MKEDQTRIDVHRMMAGLMAAAVFVTGIAGFGVRSVFAQSTPDDSEMVSEINTLKREIENKEANIEHLNSRIKEYRERIEEQQTQSVTLDGEIDLLQNRLTKTRLDIQVAEEEIDVVSSEVKLLDVQVNTLDERLDRDRGLLEDIVRKLQTTDDRLSIELLFGTDSFSQLFDELQYLENVNAELAQTLLRAKSARDEVLILRGEQEGKRARLTQLREQLSRSRQLGEEEKGAKETLLVQSQQSEAQFNALLYALKEEQAYIDQQVAALQGQLESKLSDLDDGGQSSVITWPVQPIRGLSTRFHDPTYPFRHLFEHSGIDVPTPQGTPLKAAAPGYVAWVRVGQQYGNYIMIIHTNGLATLYAHLSGISVKPDQFVTRGQVIGKTGGTPGTAGAGLSTGAHLHFEVRKKGIPVDPLNYLVLP